MLPEKMCGLFLSDVFNKYRYTLVTLLRNLTNHMRKQSSRITLSIAKNRIKIPAVVFEFIANRDTDRRDVGLCFIIRIDLV